MYKKFYKVCIILCPIFATLNTSASCEAFANIKSYIMSHDVPLSNIIISISVGGNMTSCLLFRVAYYPCVNSDRDVQLLTVVVAISTGNFSVTRQMIMKGILK